MRICHGGEKTGPRVLALGTFDGVHRGHQELIRQGKLLAAETGALLRVCVFDRHPLEVLDPRAAPRLLQTAEERNRIFAALGADELRIIPFTRETAETEPEDFLKMLRSECDLKGIVVGWNYTFGRRGRGTAELLRKMGESQGFTVLIVPPVKTGAGEIISSTAIREKLARGDLAGARDMLGNPGSN